MAVSRELALSVAGFGGFQLMTVWKDNAPSLREVRQASPNDPVIKQQLRDTDILVGGTALVLGTTVAIMSNDKTALIVLMVMFGSTSLLHHYILRQEPSYAD